MDKAVTKKWVDDARVGLNVYILYDRSGSMGSKQDEAVSAINAYARALDPDTVVTVVAFDGAELFQVVRDHVPAADFKCIVVDEVVARGMTPLYDAVGRLADRINYDAPKRAVVVIQTDGEENASRRVTQAEARQRLDSLRQRKYEVVFLGSDFKDVYKQARGLGGDAGKTLYRAAGNYVASAQSLARHTQAYGTTGQSIVMTAEEKAKLGDSGEV